MPQRTIETLPIGQRSPDQKDCVFVWFYAKDDVTYQKYQVPGKERMATALALLRWDGTFGTVGGKVDAGESLLEALVRETEEEIGYTIPNPEELVPLLTLRWDSTWHIHSYALEVCPGQLWDLRQDGTADLHAECVGVVIAPLEDYLPDEDGNPRGFSAFVQNRFCATAKTELLALRKLCLPELDG